MAVGDRTEKRFVGPVVVTNSNATIATVPAGRQWTLKQLTVCNTNSSGCWISIGITGSASVAGNCIFYRLPIIPYDTVVLDTALVMEAGETIQAVSELGALNIFVTGWEKITA